MNGCLWCAGHALRRSSELQLPTTDGHGLDRAISILVVANRLERPFQPEDLIAVNDAIVRIAAIEGEFPWLAHHDEDELFLCWEGEFRIERRDRDPIRLVAGEVFVVPAGLEHRPVAERRADTLLLERPETLQYGNR